MRTGYRKVLLVIPSRIIARGLESMLCDLGEFKVEEILTDLSPSSEARLRGTDADVIVIDPVVFDYVSRMNGRNRIAEHTDAAVAVLPTVPLDEEQLRQYDAVIDLHDDPVTVVKKLRASIAARGDRPEPEGYDLSAREKDILVCVAKGMLNKEIADFYDISIHTVITHRKNITRKTGIKTVAGLTVYALLNNLIDYSSIEL